MKITELHNPWRDKYQQASFRGAIFLVDVDVRSGGRRVALHQYAKRNVPYAEDMGRTAVGFNVAGYLIGPNYLDDKDILIGCLDQDGPGLLRLPMPYQMRDITVMVMNYSVTENREKGGYCTVEMSFVEYGDPSYRQNIASPSAVAQSAAAVEQSVIGTPTATTQQEAAPYSNLYTVSGVVE